MAFIVALLAALGMPIATLGPEWPKLRLLYLDKPLSGIVVPDAWLAAAVAHQGEHLVSFDRDFKKLPGRSRFTLLAHA